LCKLPITRGEFSPGPRFAIVQSKELEPGN
jgi:hypothetical protein